MQPLCDGCGPQGVSVAQGLVQKGYVMDQQGEKKDTTKKIIPAPLRDEIYRFWSEEDWSYQKLSDWLRDKHQIEVSREWVRRLIEREKEARVLGMAPVATMPEDLDDDQQGLRIQHEIFRAFNVAKRQGDVNGALNAARVWTQVVMTRKKLREPGPAAGEVPEESVQIPAVRAPMFKVSHGN